MCPVCKARMDPLPLRSGHLNYNMLPSDFVPIGYAPLSMIKIDQRFTYKTNEIFRCFLGTAHGR